VTEVVGDGVPVVPEVGEADEVGVLLGVGVSEAPVGDELGSAVSLGVAEGFAVGEEDFVGSALGVGSAVSEVVGRGVSVVGDVATSAGRTKR
jgi:hypothetical protein